MKTILVSGGTGFIGKKLVRALLARGDRVWVLTRSGSEKKVPEGATALVWDATSIGPWASKLNETDVVVHLAGEPVIGARWSDSQKQKIRDSRVVSTRLLVEAIRNATQRPHAFVCASAVGYYGDRDPNEVIDEESKPGTGFLADVVKAWEHEAAQAGELGIREARVRIGIVLGDGGALEKMLTPFKMFVGGPLGSGRQAMPWIHGDDMVGLLLFAIDRDEVRGPMNGTAPNPVTMREMAEALGRVLKRPSWIPAPTFALRVVLGESADAVLTGQRVFPKVAERLGYSFKFRDIEPALRDLLT
ncbi:MAG: TIGR01777 family oxidoreductase [Polyangiaceae bacterium]